MLNAAPPYRREDHATLRVPVVMPLVEVNVDTNGYLTITLDREPYCADGEFQRHDLNRVLNEIAAGLGSPVRVEVQETDDSTFTDIITPSRPTPEPTRVARKALASAFGISGEGFTAGEQVEVCVIVARQIADDQGLAQLRLPPALLAEHPRVVLLGGTSGAVVLSEGAA